MRAVATWGAAETIDKECREVTGTGGCHWLVDTQKKCEKGTVDSVLKSFLVPKGDEVEVGCSTFNVQHPI